ncbi:MAG: hypothetical protein QOE45_1682 [Frankiaceae bacterium]|jgi:hypothetical protein|nr:hypothetical protein [Frankiaceae bacterium]
MPLVRRFRPALAAALVLLVVAPVTGANAGRGGAPTGDNLSACPITGQVTSKNGWAKILSPDYLATKGEGERKITSWDPSPTERGWIYVTNGKVIQLSKDHGCRWDHIYRASTTPDGSPDTNTTVVTQVVAPTGKHLWFAGYDGSNGAYRPHVTMTTNATPIGNAPTVAFASQDTGLPTFGKPLQLAVGQAGASDGPGTMRPYLLVEQPPEGPALTPVRHLYRLQTEALPVSAIKTTSWADVPLPAGIGQIEGMTLSPTDANTIWVWGTKGFAVSRQIGDNWVAKPMPGVRTIDVDGRGLGRVYVAKGSTGAVSYVTAAGAVTPGPDVAVAPVAATHGTRPAVLAITGARGTFGFDARSLRWVDITPSDGARFVSMAMPRGGANGILLGQTADALYRFDMYPPESFLPPPRGSDGGGDGDPHLPTGITEPKLHVTRQEVTVAPGKVANDDIDWGLGPNPTPLDVFFIMDTTGSMGQAIKGLKEGINQITDELYQRTNGQACFGVGDVKDFNVIAGYGENSLKPYTLHQKIVCDRPDLWRAGVEKLTEGGGDPVEAEAQTIALTQAVTGLGQTNPPVLPNQDAGWTAENRVIVLITDAAFKQEPQFAGFPAMDTTIKTLSAYHHTKVVGVVVVDGNNLEAARGDVIAVAKGTDTVAPEKGVDCDGDHNLDLQSGDPLVCDTVNSAPHIAPAITALLLGLKDPGKVAVDTNDPHHVVRGFSAPTSGIFNRKLETHLKTTMQVTCSAAQDGQDLPLTVVGSERDVALRRVEVTVHCRGPETPDPPVVKNPPAIPEPEVVPQPIPRPLIAPVVAPQFQPPPAQQPVNMNPNAGFSQQEEQQFQLAPVSQGAEDDQEQEADELAMSRVDRTDPAAAALLLGCATFVSAAGGVALRRRTQRAFRPAYARPRG